MFAGGSDSSIGVAARGWSTWGRFSCASGLCDAKKRAWGAGIESVVAARGRGAAWAAGTGGLVEIAACGTAYQSSTDTEGRTAGVRSSTNTAASGTARVISTVVGAT